MNLDNIIELKDSLYEIPKDFKPGMRVPARIYASKNLIRNMDNAVLDQITNVSMLPGIIKYSICMPDGHTGYGFPIGGVAAIDPENGVISPGGIGFDINCGVRLVATSLTIDSVKPRLKELIDGLFKRVPSGVGSEGMLRLSPGKFNEAMVEGVRWAIRNGYGEKADLEYIEEGGCIEDADPGAVSRKACDRGKNQLGTLGSGNHYLEIQVVRKNNVFDKKTAEKFGIIKDNQVFLTIHTGSRGFGHQIATDYLKLFLSVMGDRYGLSMPDRELACAPFFSEEGQCYFRAMNCAINMAFLNRQIIMHRVREVFSEIFKKSPDDLGIRLIYDVCHNTAKLEKHVLNNKSRELLVHRKGATRAFAPGMKGLPSKYSSTGQPVIIGGSMESGGYLMAGTSNGADAFYTTAHGSGRILSRKQARKNFNGKEIQKKMLEKGIYIQTSSYSGLAEEAGGAYKNIDEVIKAIDLAGLSRPVAKLIPIGNIKG